MMAGELNRWVSSLAQMGRSRPDRRRVPHRGHQLPVAPRLHPKHAKARLRIVERDPLHQSREDLARAGCGDASAPIRAAADGAVKLHELTSSPP